MSYPRMPFIPESCNKTGATELKNRIEAYWRERGYDVHVELHPARFTQVMRADRWDLRSDMKNGVPTRRSTDKQISVSMSP